VKVVVGGGTGYVGRALVASLRADGHVVTIASRHPSGPDTVSWDTVGSAVDGADAVVNLAGVSIGSLRWTRGRKEAIRRSRVQTTQRLVQEISVAKQPPRVFVTASGIDYAGDSGDVLVDETSRPGSSFLAQVCVAWEAAAAEAPVRHVAVRNALVVGRGAQAVRLTALPYRFFLGGPAGGGRQWFPWIHVDDAVRVYRLAIDDESLEGPLDAVAPEQLRQREAARILGRVLHRPALVPTPGLALRLLLGEQADLVLHGQRALSRKLDGFEFNYRGLRAAFENALT
jgi:uncharacterized protein (TIGR01777 family)